MNALQQELRRLYLTPAGDAAARRDPDAPAALLGAGDATRCLVLELARPADWRALGRAWQGAQAELDLPAPGIAVSGTDGMQLWFSLERPVPAAQGHAFLQALADRFLPDTAPARLGLMPSADGARHAAPVPAPRGADGNWSAFVAPDLAPVFGETPWLDIPPGEEGQAALLRALQPIGPAAFAEAAHRLQPQPAAGSAGAPAAAPRETFSDATGDGDARAFLRRVMDDAGVPLALRIEAAKALLSAPGADARP
ncbi:MAG: hypothetical protein PGN26_01740 [Xylophilus ampelinus]